MKQVTVSIHFIGGRKRERHITKAPHGKILTAGGVDEILKAMATYVEQAFPDREFRLVPLRDGNFNFVEVKPEEMPASA